MNQTIFLWNIFLIIVLIIKFKEFKWFSLYFCIRFISARCSFDEQGAKNAIIDVLEEFTFGDNPETVLAKIRGEENASTVCGRVFKMNEPFYSCRECGMDPTCVLCVNCFKQSAHRHHKYKMGTSGGGGCCDCGDNEAWKQDHYCDEHKVRSGTNLTSLRRFLSVLFFLEILHVFFIFSKKNTQN